MNGPNAGNVIDLRAALKREMASGHKHLHRLASAGKQDFQEFSFVPRPRDSDEREAEPPASSIETRAFSDPENVIQQDDNRGFDSLIGSMTLLIQMESLRSTQAPAISDRGVEPDARPQDDMTGRAPVGRIGSEMPEPLRIVAALPEKQRDVPEICSAKVEVKVQNDLPLLTHAAPPAPQASDRVAAVEIADVQHSDHHHQGTEAAAVLHKVPVWSREVPEQTPHVSLVAAPSGMAASDEQPGDASAGQTGEQDNPPAQSGSGTVHFQTISEPRPFEIAETPARQIIEHIRQSMLPQQSQHAEPSQTLRVMLAPEGLGAVEITISRENETLRVVLRTEKSETKLALAEDSAALRDLLSAIEGSPAIVECEVLDLHGGERREEQDRPQERASGDLAQHQQRDRRARQEWTQEFANGPDRGVEAEQKRGDSQVIAENRTDKGADRGGLYL